MSEQYLKILEQLGYVDIFLEEAPIVDEKANTIGWHSSVLNLEKNALSSGCAETREVARRIAIAEAIERAMFKRMLASPQAKEFCLDQIPSSSGFAVGFEKEATAFRSLCEAVERWAWSQWIDERYCIDEAQPASVTALAANFLQYFEKVRFFQKKIFIDDIAQGNHELLLHIVIGEKDGGVFPGSRLTSSKDDGWTHASLEAWRHLKIVEVSQLRGDKKQLDIIEKRIRYFAMNGVEAWRQIEATQSSGKRDWKSPELLLMKELIIPDGSFYLWRSLCKDYLSWHLGSNSRFVY